LAINVSVIVPNYNHAVYLNQRIDSILNQSFNDFELIILDDCSTDNSKEVIKNYENKAHVSHIVFNNENSGSTFYQWQKGIELAKGDLVWIAESDDFCRKDFLEKMVSCFTDSEVVLAYSRSCDVDENSNIMGLSYSHLDWCDDSFIKSGNLEINDHLYLENTIPNVSAVIFRKSAVGKSIQANYKLCGDWYFYINLLKRGKIAYVSEPLNYHRFHVRNVRSSQLKLYNGINERLEIVEYIKRENLISESKYLQSIKFQIAQFVSQTPFARLFSVKAIKFIISAFGWDLKKYFYLLCKIVTKSLSKFRLTKK
jgi:glycosyltransferase involved in cell wall biosynthesis